MVAIGWGLDQWRLRGDKPGNIFNDHISDELLCNMAGNAFSAYAFGPMAVATIACMARDAPKGIAMADIGDEAETLSSDTDSD